MTLGIIVLAVTLLRKKLNVAWVRDDEDKLRPTTTQTLTEGTPIDI